MKPNLQRRLLAGLLWLLAFGVVPPLYSEPELIRAPFGLRWGQAPEDLEEILRRSQIAITAKVQDGDNLSIEVSSLPQKNLLRTIFLFESGILCEVELQLGQPGWKETDYYRFFLQSKKVLDSRYGRGVPLVRDRRIEGDTETFLSGYGWSQFGGNLRLFLFGATSADEKIFVLSQHYRPF